MAVRRFLNCSQRRASSYPSATCSPTCVLRGGKVGSGSWRNHDRCRSSLSYGGPGSCENLGWFTRLSSEPTATNCGPLRAVEEHWIPGPCRWCWTPSFTMNVPNLWWRRLRGMPMRSGVLPCPFCDESGSFWGVHGDVQGYEAREGAGPSSSSSTPSALAQWGLVIAAGAMASGKGHYAWTQRAKQRSGTWRRQVASMERAFEVRRLCLRELCGCDVSRWTCAGSAVGCSPLEGRRGTSRPKQKTVASVLQSTSVSCEIPRQQFGGVTAWSFLRKCIRQTQPSQGWVGSCLSACCVSSPVEGQDTAVSIDNQPEEA